MATSSTQVLPGQFLSATPFEETDEYQNPFRNELPLRRCTGFFGVVGASKTLHLSTYLGSSRGKSPLKGLLVSGSRPDLEMSVPSFGKPGASAAGRALALGKAAKNLRSLLDKPMDLPLQMKLSFSGGDVNTIYGSNLSLGFDVTGEENDIPMLAAISLTNPNPLNSGIFFFTIYFLPPAVS